MIKIITDSDCDMPREFFGKYDVGVVPFGVSYGDEKYHTDFYELRPEEFFKKCRETDAFPKTSQPVEETYKEYFRPALGEGKDIICLCISSKFSGSYSSAVMAQESLKSEFPDRKIAVIDTLRCTAMHGYLVYQICLMLESGMDFDTIVSTVETIKNDQFTYVTVDNLEYLRKGGRLGKGAALLGSLLSVKPIIGFADGELFPHSKVRGKKNAVAELFKGINNAVGDNKDKYVPIAFSSDLPEDTALLAKEFEANGYGPLIHQWSIGPVVGAHLGPTGFAITLVRKYEGQTVF